MKILKINEFINNNSTETISIVDPYEIKQKLIYIEKYSISHPCNCSTNSIVNQLEKRNDSKADELTKILATLDISPELIDDPEIEKLLTQILIRSLVYYYTKALDENLYIDDIYNEPNEMGENGESSSLHNVIEFSVDFDKSLKYISSDVLYLKTYNLKLYYDYILQELSYIDLDGNSDDLNHTSEFVDLLSDIYDDYCKQLKKETI